MNYHPNRGTFLSRHSRSGSTPNFWEKAGAVLTTIQMNYISQNASQARDARRRLMVAMQQVQTPQTQVTRLTR